jgi:DNA invertase Pin-like site-specific DNA recombinase
MTVVDRLAPKRCQAPTAIVVSAGLPAPTDAKVGGTFVQFVAELEAGFISDRTKAALAAAKRRGKKLGGFRAGAKLTMKARQKGAKANTEAAAARAADLAP